MSCLFVPCLGSLLVKENVCKIGNLEYEKMAVKEIGPQQISITVWLN